MSFIRKVRRKIGRVTSGLDTPKEFMLYCWDFALRSAGLDSNLYTRAYWKRLLKDEPRDTDSYRIKGIRLPVINKGEENTTRLDFLLCEEILLSYLKFNDDYSEELFNKLDELMGGLYCLVNDKVNVTVTPGDIVIDAGSCCGTFAAYASVKGAVCYAFEPADDNLAYVKKTAQLNDNIIPVNKGLYDESTVRNIFMAAGRCAANTFIEERKPGDSVSKVEVVRLDDFVRDNNLPRVDFIKADIEGAERHMLAGAQETLARFAPKLALCTYHLPEDPQVMAELILKANPKYNIVQKRMKLFASVPE